MRGLFGRPRLARGEGMLIDPCGMVHTFGMSYSLDLVFLDRSWRVRKLVASLHPMRVAGSFGAARTLEMAEGGLADLDLRMGDTLTWRSE